MINFGRELIGVIEGPNTWSCSCGLLVKRGDYNCVHSYDTLVTIPAMKVAQS